jgi:hypothetical protein
VSAPETSRWAAQLQIGQLNLHESSPGKAMWTCTPLDDDEVSALPAEAANVARLYRQLAADLHEGTRHVPTFRDAQALHALIQQAKP